MRYIKLNADQNIKTKKLLKNHGFSNRSIREILQEGYLINEKKTSNNKDLKTNDSVKVIIEDENLDYEPIKGNLDIIYEDFDILVLNKPANITVNSKNQISLANFLAYYFLIKEIKSKIRFVNRLDMNTSGLILIAKHKFAQSYYQNEIEKNRFIKKYIAVVSGNLKIDREIEVKLTYDNITKRYDVGNMGKIAKTIFKTERYDKDKNISYIICDIKTGKTHQIRSTLSSLSHPIIGDTLYGSKEKMDRFLLHSFYLNFTKFITGENISLEVMPIF